MSLPAPRHLTSADQIPVSAREVFRFSNGAKARRWIAPEEAAYARSLFNVGGQSGDLFARERYKGDKLSAGAQGESFHTRYLTLLYGNQFKEAVVCSKCRNHSHCQRMGQSATGEWICWQCAEFQACYHLPGPQVGEWSGDVLLSLVHLSVADPSHSRTTQTPRIPIALEVPRPLRSAMRDDHWVPVLHYPKTSDETTTPPSPSPTAGSAFPLAGSSSACTSSL
jgi:hypothetical protein